MFSFDIDSKEYKKIHFVGIGGVSMSGIAGLLKSKGFIVTGSDRCEGDYIAHLRSLGIEVAIGQNSKNIKDQDLFIYTDAIKMDNEELSAAFNTGKPCISRGVFLGALMRNYKKSIAISGMHGKSTTTAMVTKILLDSPIDPTILLGGSFDDIEGNFKTGTSEYMVTEACEYKGNILHYYPKTAIVLNIDVEHVDYYRDMEHIIETFKRYMENLDENSKAILNVDDKNVRKLVGVSKGKSITYGIESSDTDYKIENIKFSHIGYPSFDLVKGNNTFHFKLNILGRFNIYNAAAAIIASYENGIAMDLIQKAIGEYKSLHRRLDVVGTYNGATIIDDYGHHPREIKVTLEALKEHCKGRLICVFQPHTYSRTLRLLDDYGKSFFNADKVVITRVFPARETEALIHGKNVVEKLRENKVDAIYKDSFDEASDYMIKVAKKDDIIVVTGCGDNNGITRMMLKKIEKID